MRKYVCHAYLSSSAKLEPNTQYGFDRTVCDSYRNDSDLDLSTSIGFLFKEFFERDGPSGAKTAKGEQQRIADKDSHDDRVMLGQLAEVLHLDCSNAESRESHYTVYITNFYHNVIMLGETTNIIPVQLPEVNTTQGLMAAKDMVLSYRCKDQWALGKGNGDKTGDSENEETMSFFVFSQMITVGFL